jgi:hypothetical protein
MTFISTLSFESSEILTVVTSAKCGNQSDFTRTLRRVDALLEL